MADTAKPERKATTYRIEVDPDASQGSALIEVGDRLYIGNGLGFSREQAIADLLDTGDSDRLTDVRKTLDEGREIVFYVTPTSATAAVPVSTEVKRERKIGR